MKRFLILLFVLALFAPTAFGVETGINITNLQASSTDSITVTFTLTIDEGEKVDVAFDIVESDGQDGLEEVNLETHTKWRNYTGGTGGSTHILESEVLLPNEEMLAYAITAKARNNGGTVWHCDTACVFSGRPVTFTLNECDNVDTYASSAPYPLLNTLVKAPMLHDARGPCNVIAKWCIYDDDEGEQLSPYPASNGWNNVDAEAYGAMCAGGQESHWDFPNVTESATIFPGDRDGNTILCKVKISRQTTNWGGGEWYNSTDNQWSDEEEFEWTLSEWGGRP